MNTVSPKKRKFGKRGKEDDKPEAKIVVPDTRKVHGSLYYWIIELFYRQSSDGEYERQGSKLWRTLAWITFFSMVWLGGGVFFLAFIKGLSLSSPAVTLFGIILGAVGAKAVIGEFSYNQRRKDQQPQPLSHGFPLPSGTGNRGE